MLHVEQSKKLNYFLVDFRRKRDFVKKLEFHFCYTGTGGGMNLRDGLDASGRKPKVSVLCFNLLASLCWLVLFTL
jgi:hypothetical protein